MKKTSKYLLLSLVIFLPFSSQAEKRVAVLEKYTSLYWPSCNRSGSYLDEWADPNFVAAADHDTTSSNNNQGARGNNRMGYVGDDVMKNWIKINYHIIGGNFEDELA